MLLVALLALLVPGCRVMESGGPEDVPPPVTTTPTTPAEPSGRKPGGVNI
jgi:hypothetical protein